MTASATDINPFLEAALAYAARNWPVFPVHSPTVHGPQCSCRNKKCSSPAKHPRTSNGLNDASIDVATIEAWWRQWPDANVGIRTGNGLVAIDIDSVKGGDLAWEYLETTNGRAPDGPVSHTGSGGRHLLFRTPRNARVANSASKIGQAVDVRGDGGYIVAPPSKHVCGGTYLWELSSDPTDSTTPLPEMPPWLFALVSADRSPTTSTSTAHVEDIIPEGRRDDTIYKLACSLRAKGLGPDEMLGALTITNRQRCVPPLDEVDVKRIVSSACRHAAGLSPEYAERKSNVVPLRPTDTPVREPGEDVDEWASRLHRTEKGNIKPTVGNACTILRNAPDYAGKLSFDTMAITPRMNDEPLLDHDVTRLREHIEHSYLVALSKESATDAILSIAHEREIHPLREYLKGLPEWDGQPRIARMLEEVLRVEPTDIAQKQLRCWFVALMVRAMEPGTKVDNVLVLIGEQGGRKSTFFRTLGHPWFSDTAMDITNKDAYLQLAATWIYEWGEIERVTGRRGSDEVKQFLSSSHDTFRAPFARAVTTNPRGCVIVGTTNKDQFLTDPTGARRFWILRCRDRIDITRLSEWRTQVLAEALAAYHAGERHYLEDADERARDVASLEHIEVDAWQEIVGDWLYGLERGVVVTTKKVLSNALRLEPRDQGRTSRDRVVLLMRALGYVEARQRIAGELTRCWVKRDATRQESMPEVEQ